MDISDILKNESFSLLTTDENALKNQITGVFCCDLLSIAMGKAKKSSAWITVMANINTVAVASLAEVSCIILAENVSPVDDMLKKANENSIPILKTELPIFESGLIINEMISSFTVQ